MASDDGRQNARRSGGVTRTVNAGFAHHQAGRLERAQSLYRKALEKDPGNSDALHLLGVAAYQRGDSAAAIELIERALPDLLDLPEVHLNLGNALREAGRLAEAVDRYRRAIAIEPGYGMAHSNLGRALIDQGALEAGLECSRRAVELIPDFLGAHVNCAAALLGLERFAEAEPAFRRALELQPGDASLYSDLGRVLTRLGRLDDAVACHERAITLSPDDARLRFALGWTQYWAHDFERSEASLRQALSACPELVAAWQLLGHVMAVRGRFEESSSCYRRALDLDPDLPEADYGLAEIGQQARGEAELERLEATLANPDHAPTDRVAAGFALATLLDNAGRYDEAFRCLAAANALHRQQRAALGDHFDAAALQREVERHVTVFTPELFSAVAGWGSPSEAPVFVVGMPRSGTTLVEQIAASHSRVFGAGERPDVGRLAAALTARNRDRPFGAWDAGFARQLAAAHVASLQKLGNGALRVIDKAPDNVFSSWHDRRPVPGGSRHSVPTRCARHLPFLLFSPVRRGPRVRLRFGGLRAAIPGVRPAGDALARRAAARAAGHRL